MNGEFGVHAIEEDGARADISQVPLQMLKDCPWQSKRGRQIHLPDMRLEDENSSRRISTQTRGSYFSCR